jgi:shikimate kinase
MPAPSKKANLFLTGMMGAGKTTIGRNLAVQLGYRFLDTDYEIANEIGLTVKEIFQIQGEKSFREQERKLLLEIVRDEHQIIACGGGMLLPKGNLKLAQTSGLVVLLHAPVQVLLHRVSENSDRPLLEGHDLASRLDQLLKVREPFYSAINDRVDTSGEDVDRIASTIISLYRSWLKS